MSMPLLDGEGQPSVCAVRANAAIVPGRFSTGLASSSRRLGVRAAMRSCAGMEREVESLHGDADRLSDRTHRHRCVACSQKTSYVAVSIRLPVVFD